MTEYFEGTVEQILFYNPENGYTVSKFLLDDGQPFTIVGAFPPLSPGEKLKISGQWEINPKFGQQFRVDNFIPVLPSSVKGIEKFLASGLIKGIGLVLARRIIEKFGPETLDVLGKKPERLAEVEGVGRVKLAEIKKSWAEHQEIRDLIIFLQEHNVSTSLATKVYRQYGDRSYQILKTNPYQLSLDIWGIGFKTADQIALKLGMDPSSLERVKAYILYLLEKDIEQGHVFSFLKDIKERSAKELELEEARIDEALKELIKKKLVITEDLDLGIAVYLPFYFHAQGEVVQAFHKLAGSPVMEPPFDVEKVILEVEKEMRISFSALQRKAIGESLARKILIITGGPGTGKTTIIRAVVEVFKRWEKKVFLAAPTGRAAKRLSEATREQAKTLHRMLEFNPKTGAFRKNERHPLKGEALIIDEFSMVDLPLMFHLLKAVPDGMHLILVGDKDQLPAVGPGNLLQQIIESQRAEVVKLDEIFRQEKDSLIVVNAHRINQGQSLVYPPKGDKTADFYFLHQKNEEAAFKTIMTLACFSIPQKLNLSPLSPHIQVISPMYKGGVGVDRLNAELQKRLNKHREGLRLGTREFRLHDKVMQIRNNYEKEIFNGDIGIVVHIDKQRYRILVDFDGRAVPFEKDEMNDITHAYAVSVHKSQGSEYQAVIMPLLTQHFIMLQRNLFYTALTRARRMSVIVGSYKALHIAIKNDKPVRRNCLIKEKLIQLASESF